MLRVVDDIWYSHFLCICMHGQFNHYNVEKCLNPSPLGVCVCVYIQRHRHQERYTHKTKTTCHTNLILSLSLSLSLSFSLKLAKMSSAGNMSLYCPSCKRYVTIVLCESSCSAPHCSLCNWCLCESHSHNRIPKTTTKENETNKAECTSKSTKEKNPTSKNNVKENDNQTNESQMSHK